MNFKQWLFSEELGSDQKEMIEKWGYQYVDGITAGDYEMFLLYSDKYPEDFQYHLALQRSDTSVFNINQQMDKDRDQRKQIPMHSQFTAMEPFIKRLKEWCKKYGKLIIASNNPRRTVKWLHSLIYAAREYNIDFNIETDTVFGQTYHAIS